MGVGFSFLAIVLSVFQIPIELQEHGKIPARIQVMLAIALSILSVSVYLSHLPRWKVGINYLLYILSICSLGVMMHGVKILLLNILENTT